MKDIELRTPLDTAAVKKLKAGDRVLISGTIYTARDAAHKRMVKSIEHGEKPPFDLKGQVIYYTGPTPARPGQVIGSSGPTTSSRMDIYTTSLLSLGLKGMIGKGNRSKAVREAMHKYGAVYFAALGGAGALISKCIKKAEVIACAELGTEAILRLDVERFPVVVINDIYGRDLYEIARDNYSRRAADN